MNQVRARALLLCASVALAAGAVLNGLSVAAGGAELLLPQATVFLALIVGAVVLFYARQVAKFQDVSTRAQAPRMNALLAARVAVFAQSSAFSGALILGWHVALLGFELTLYTQRGAFDPVITAVLGLVTGGILLGAGLWAESMCKIPPNKDAGTSSASSPRTGEGFVARND
ncbi:MULTISPECIES: DUF3180 domain-containing protein [unclassified Rothia (in: high G+C Gram-positive bacteria)]|uniref:DUF3180 domain-containing protein n=1 Tax=unclassified Rothia (in: high G+C Gram-positive bacteria) TaxID=2689056 RepID=UPI00195AB945|nr:MULTISPECIES: DUF3180 domain-containing protein [unclassified Rothia (in: high G+C Gram-positive bacteria)]MBM7051611.1 DUF3180 domain-containing protein [Rothia sp. ZJ1223]QRZ61754.1 DUF3180 domain-containing protein [Rothia sp. ZJ932]